ncbi:MAG: sigma-70 family RNA polymerase sigma factor [Clostridia bacterium]|nr:sigma-70 family RNA polymerase sigma factor [Clostridia bacterium]
MNLKNWVKTLVNALQRNTQNEDSVFYINGSDTLPPPLSTEEEQYHLSRLVTGNETSRDVLIEHNLRLVVYIARKFEVSILYCSIEDLISIGTIGLIKAVNTYCPGKNIKLATYASRCIENEILMYLRKTGNLRNEVSIEEPLNIDWDGNELLLCDVLDTGGEEVGTEIEREDEVALLKEEVLRLSPRSRKIIELRYGFSGDRPYTQKEVADLLGISQSYISRLEKKILGNLREKLREIV